MNELVSLVKASNLDKKSVSKVLGVSERTLYRWLAGDTKVPIVALKLARILLKPSRA